MCQHVEYNSTCNHTACPALHSLQFHLKNIHKYKAVPIHLFQIIYWICTPYKSTEEYGDNSSYVELFSGKLFIGHTNTFYTFLYLSKSIKCSSNKKLETDTKKEQKRQREKEGPIYIAVANKSYKLWRYQ